MSRTGRHGAVLLAVAGVVVASAAACGGSKAKPPSPPPSFADVVCGGGAAAYSGLWDVLNTTLLQQALDAGRFPTGAPAAPPAGAKWLVDGKIDKSVAASSVDYAAWATEPDAASYIDDLDRVALDTMNLTVCATWDGSNAVRAEVQAMTSGGMGPLMCDGFQGWQDYLAFQDAVVLQAAFDTGRFPAGTPDAPPHGAPWFTGGKFLPGAAAKSADYTTWAARPDVASFFETYRGVANSTRKSECQTSPSKGATTR